MDLAGINCVAAVVAGAVFDVGDLVNVASTCFGAQLIKQTADGFDDVDVGFFVPAADVVDLARFAGFQYAPDSAAVVAYIQPVSYLHAIAINRQRFASQRVDNHQRNELFGEVQRAIVVAAVGGEHRQAVGVVVGAGQMVAGGFAGAVGAVGLIGFGFGEWGIICSERAINFVRRDVQVPKS